MLRDGFHIARVRTYPRAKADDSGEHRPENGNAGESMYLIRVRDERVKLAPCGSWDTRGGDDPDEWQVQVDTYGPTSSSKTKLISYSEVLHFKWSYDSALPWVGVGPDARGPVTRTAAWCA